MAKSFFLASGREIQVSKKRQNKNLRISITPAGLVRVSIPSWAPYRAGIQFAQKRERWINEHSSPASRLHHEQSIGKAHHLVFIAHNEAIQPRATISKSQVQVKHSLSVAYDHQSVQDVAKKASIRALRLQAEQLLPQKLEALALANDFAYTSVKIKMLRSRWGSCDQSKNIVLNLYLMQLPWHCIEYVLMHELVHTKILKHGPEFWREMKNVLPKTNDIRKEMRTYQPVLAT